MLWQQYKSVVFISLSLIFSVLVVCVSEQHFHVGFYDPRHHCLEPSYRSCQPGEHLFLFLELIFSGLEYLLRLYFILKTKSLFAVCLWSAFLNNTPIVALMIPIITAWSRVIKLPISKFMIPLSYVSELGGVCTLIGTSTNLVIKGTLHFDYHELKFKLNYF